MQSIIERARTWRNDAATLRKYGQDQLADLLEQVAAELQAGAAAEHRTVTLTEAVELSGFSRGHLRRLFRDGKLRNVGTWKDPKILMADLPRKTGYNPENKSIAGRGAQPVNYQKQVARAVVRSRRRTNDGAEEKGVELRRRA